MCLFVVYGISQWYSFEWCQAIEPIRIILPILVFIVLLQAYASLKPEHKKVESVMKAMNAIFGFGFLFFTIYKMITIPGELFTFVSLKSFLLPVLLTILFVPFIYLLALYSHYESLFIRLKFLEKEKPLRKSLKWQILKVANINLNKLSNISGGIAKLLLVDKIRSFDEIKKISKDTRL